MGACCGNTQTIDFQFDEPDHQYEHHILLLGTGIYCKQRLIKCNILLTHIYRTKAHSGKTTLLKQMRKIHGPYPSTNGSTHSLIHGYIHQSSAMIPEEIYGVIELFYADRVIDVGFETIIRERIVNYMKILCTQSIKLGIDIDERNIAFQHFFANQLKFPFTAENDEKMKKLWADDGIKETLKRRREYDIADNVEYFMDQRIDDIVSTDYVVTFGDFLRIGMRTTGYMREIFKRSIYGTEHQFIFTDGT